MRNLSSNKATWSNSDLKSLPRAALADLAQILSAPCHAGFPAYMMRARVAVLGKVDVPRQASQARPITILSCLYRLWARVLTYQVLACRSRCLPQSVQGCLKGRSSTDLAYWIQHKTEGAMDSGTECSGCALDLIKAYNTLPRPPMYWLLQFLGWDPALVCFWATSMEAVERSFQTHRSLGPGVPASAGAFEGDPVAVLGMIGFCVAYDLIIGQHATPRSFVDNWGWSVQDKHQHRPTIHALHDFTDAARLRVDWKKTYVFATNGDTRRWWRDYGVRAFPCQEAVQVVSQVKELGCHLQFNKRRCLGHLPDLFEESVARLHRLFHSPAFVSCKALVVQNGVWSHAFHGAFSTVPGKARMNYLRSNAARAVVGRYHTLTPWAALTLLPTLQESEVYLMLLQIRQLRRMFKAMPSVAAAVLARATRPEFPKTVYGPATALRVLFDRNGWTLHANGKFSGPGNVAFNVKYTAHKDVARAITRAWCITVQAACQHRYGLQHLANSMPRG